MYVAVASMSPRWVGEDFEKMIKYVDSKNSDGRYYKYFLLELDNCDYSLYRKNKSLQYCHPTIVYDPCGVGESYLKGMVMYGNGFARTFGSRSGDH